MILRNDLSFCTLLDSSWCNQHDEAIIHLFGEIGSTFLSPSFQALQSSPEDTRPIQPNLLIATRCYIHLSWHFSHSQMLSDVDLNLNWMLQLSFLLDIPSVKCYPMGIWTNSLNSISRKNIPSVKLNFLEKYSISQIDFPAKIFNRQKKYSIG